MKTYIKYLKFITALSCLTVLLICSSCKDDKETKSPVEEQLQTLVNGSPWILAGNTVLKDGFDVSSQFTGFTLTFSESNFSTTNSLPSAWPNAGTWQFVNENPNKIIRGDGVEIDLQLADNKLILNFMVSDPNSGGRGLSVAGEYQFTLESE